MKCPYCGEIDSKVIDSRPADDGERIRRRRECLVCQKRFTTYEIVETVPLMVVKKDKSREAFNRQKLLNGCFQNPPAMHCGGGARSGPYPAQRRVRRPSAP